MIIGDILKKVYGNEIYEEKIKKLNNKEFDELSGNLSSGIPRSASWQSSPKSNKFSYKRSLVLSRILKS